MADPTDLVGYTPDLQTSGVWFGAPNAVAHRGCFPRELSLVWAFLPDPRARPIPRDRRGPTGTLRFVASGAGQWLFPTFSNDRETTVFGYYGSMTVAVKVPTPATTVVHLSSTIVDLTSTIESSSPRG